MAIQNLEPKKAKDVKDSDSRYDVLELGGTTFKRPKQFSENGAWVDNVNLPEELIHHPHLSFLWVNDHSVAQKREMGWERVTSEEVQGLITERIVSRFQENKKAVLMKYPKKWILEKRAEKLAKYKEGLTNKAQPTDKDGNPIEGISIQEGSFAGAVSIEEMGQRLYG